MALIDRTPTPDTTPVTGMSGEDGWVGSGVAGRVGEFRSWLADIDPAALTDRERVEVLRCLEGLKGGAAAAQARVTDAFATSQTGHAQHHTGPHDTGQHDTGQRDTGQEKTVRDRARLTERSIGSQVGLARKDTPSAGDQHVRLAHALVHDLPGTLAALTRGDISEARAAIVANQTADLRPADRRAVDARVAGLLGSLGDRGTTTAVRRAVAHVDADAVTRRAAAARASRRVTMRAAADGMAWLTFLAPLPEVIAAHSTLHRLAAAAQQGPNAAAGTPSPVLGETRSHGQLMADLGLDRLLGRVSELNQPPAADVTINLVMKPESLFGADAHTSTDTSTDAGTDTGVDSTGEQHPACLPGHGPLTAALARELVGRAGKVWIRRLFTSPDGRHLVAMDSTRRLFDGALRELIVLRDQTCRTPWCEATIRVIDHAHPARHGGPTSVENGVGLCERCNYTKEAPGWRTDVTHHSDPDHGPHTIRITTPTGHHEQSTAPPLHGWGSDPPPDPNSDPGNPNQHDDLHDLSPLERHLTLLLTA